MDLIALDGVGEKKAEVLREHGYKQLEDVAYASLIHFDEVPTASRDLIVQAQKVLRDNPYIGYRIDQATLDPNLVDTYWCSRCSKSFSGTQALFALDHHECNTNEPDWVLKQ